MFGVWQCWTAARTKGGLRRSLGVERSGREALKSSLVASCAHGKQGERYIAGWKDGNEVTDGKEEGDYDEAQYSGSERGAAVRVYTRVAAAWFSRFPDRPARPSNHARDPASTANFPKSNSPFKSPRFSLDTRTPPRHSEPGTHTLSPLARSTIAPGARGAGLSYTARGKAVRGEQLAGPGHPQMGDDTSAQELLARGGLPRTGRGRRKKVWPGVRVCVCVCAAAGKQPFASAPFFPALPDLGTAVCAPSRVVPWHCLDGSRPVAETMHTSYVSPSARAGLITTPGERALGQKRKSAPSFAFFPERRRVPMSTSYFRC